MRPDFIARKLKDDQLISQLKRWVHSERRMQSHILAHLGEMEQRKLYAVLGYSSLFNYVTEELGYSEASAFKRIQVARAAVKFPQIYALIEEGSISLTALLRLCPHLKVSNHEQLLSGAQNKSVKEVEKMLCVKFPKPVPPDSIKPVSKDRVWFSFCADEAFAKQVEQAKALLRHRYPKANLKDLFQQALNTFLNQEKKKKTAVQIPRQSQARSRHIAQPIKAAVWKRDEGRCSYVSAQGRRCAESGFLEFDHKLPWSLGGSSNDADNIRLLCQTHNRLMADEYFGVQYIKSKIAKKHSGFQKELRWNRFHIELWECGGMKKWRETKALYPKKSGTNSQ